MLMKYLYLLLKYESIIRGSTALDFAYGIHTEVGHRCKGALINGEIVTWYSFENGDRVEILIKSAQPVRLVANC